MKILAIALFLFCFICSFAGDIVVGIQNGIGQSYELNRYDVSSLWGYRGAFYFDFATSKNIKIEPLLSFSQKGSISKLHETSFDPNNPYAIITTGVLDLPSRSQIVSFAIGIKPFYSFDKIDIFAMAAPRVDYLFKRTIDNSALGGGLEDITRVTTKWIPGINLDAGFDYKIKSFLIGLVFNNEFDLNYTKADFGDTFRSYKYSILLNIGYTL